MRCAPQLRGLVLGLEAMKCVLGNLRTLAHDRRAVTALEYGILAGVLGLNLISIFRHFGSTLSTLFSTVSASI